MNRTDRILQRLDRRQREDVRALAVETQNFRLAEQGIEKSRDFDQFYRDSADEISMQFLGAYKERFGREPPQTLVEYAFPLMDASSSRKDEVRAALDAAYSRLRAAAVEREAPSEGVFLACPRGLRKA